MRSALSALIVTLFLLTPALVGAEPPGPPILSDVRTIDGKDNNESHRIWGAALTPFVRLLPDDYADGSGAPSGADRESARAISNAVFAQTDSIPNSTGLTDFVWQWGQFLDHDIDLTPVIDPPEPFDIEVPIGDPWFDPEATGDVVIPLDRSAYFMIDGVRQQINGITAFIDASNVYGSDRARARELRTLDGTGRLKTSEGGLPPFNVNGLPNAPTSDDARYFLAGDFRANEQVALTAMHALFVREHNTWAARLERKLVQHGHIPPRSRGGRGGDRDERRRDDLIYEMTRALVAAEMQVITYRDFLPALLGPDAMQTYTGYDRRMDPSIRNMFATAAYRFGHSMLSPTLRRLDEEGNTIAQGDLPLAEAFFRPDELIATGIEPLLRGLASQQAQEIDAKVIDAVRNFLFGPPGSAGFDLASLNIQRGRDHGLPGYNAVRIGLGLAPAEDFDDISSDPEVQAALASVYATVDDVDLWVGGLAEDHDAGAALGETFARVIAEQFEALRDGDRFWYSRYLPPPMVRAVERQSLAKIIRRNTDIGGEISGDVFRFAAE